MSTTDSRVPARLWSIPDEPGEGEREDVDAYLDVESDDGGPGRVAIHTFIDGRGSMVSYYLDREAAIQFARMLLQAVELP
jgi:hypothetical protein